MLVSLFNTIPPIHRLPWKIIIFGVPVPVLVGVAAALSFDRPLGDVGPYALGPCVAIAIAGLWLLRRQLAALRESTDAGQSICPMCGYTLQGTEQHQCPECGLPCSAAEARVINQRYAAVFARINVDHCSVEWKSRLGGVYLVFRIIQANRWLLLFGAAGLFASIAVLSSTNGVIDLSSFTFNLGLATCMFWPSILVDLCIKNHMARTVARHRLAIDMDMLSEFRAFMKPDWIKRPQPNATDEEARFWLTTGPIDWRVVGYNREKNCLVRLGEDINRTIDAATMSTPMQEEPSTQP